ncbi:MAG: 2-phospho-L-lactate guanylyltransferase [Actinobacteria bacterium]|nr:2-phospho-L-lactate guanylyltransferase [Actinomycetota bacterium]
MTLSWLVLVPIKSTRIGKSRIALDPESRRRLARAMALDTVTAVAAADRVGGVWVLVDDPADGDLFRGMPGVCARRTGVVGLNDVIREACGALPAMGGDDSRPVAVLPADLPSLEPGELDDALRQAVAVPRAVVPDRQGTGTTLLAARDAAQLRPQYGPGSFAAHRVSGAAGLQLPDDSGLRCDVDVIADLAGVTGRYTRSEAGDLVSPATDRQGVG